MALRPILIAVVSALLFFPLLTEAQVPTIEQLKAQIDALKADYDKRIKDLEDQVQQLQTQMLQAPSAEEQAGIAAPPPIQTIPGALNPAIAVAANFVSRADDQKIFNGDA